jgi:hypothetical protein
MQCEPGGNTSITGPDRHGEYRMDRLGKVQRRRLHRASRDYPDFISTAQLGFVQRFICSTVYLPENVI